VGFSAAPRAFSDGVAGVQAASMQGKIKNKHIEMKNILKNEMRFMVNSAVQTWQVCMDALPTQNQLLADF
jgi:hypothetical protein